MKYRNKDTGVIIESSSKICGDNWEEVVAEKKKDEPKKVEQVEEAQEEVHEEPNVIEEQPKLETPGQPKSFDDITVEQIKQELTAFGVEIPKNAKKQELYDLMMSKGK